MAGEELALNWYRLKDRIDRALYHGGQTTTSYHLFTQCMMNVAQCWVKQDEFGSVQGVAITRLSQFDTFRGLEVVTVTAEGFLDEACEFIELVEDYARSEECKRVIFYGRKGWKKLMEPCGYEEKYITMMKEV